MSRRTVAITNATAPTEQKVRGANLNEIRVEIRVIFPEHIAEYEAQRVLNDAYLLALLDLNDRIGYAARHASPTEAHRQQLERGERA